MRIATTLTPTTLEEALSLVSYWKNQALTDDLTGIYHRRALADHISNIEGDYIMFMVDLNKFKPVNDTAGHEAGDAALKAIAHSLRRGTDFVCRWGGDEFIIIATAPPEQALSLYYRIKSAVAGADFDEYLPDTMKGHRCDCAIGISYSTESTYISELVALADERMFADKSNDAR